MTCTRCFFAMLSSRHILGVSICSCPTADCYTGFLSAKKTAPAFGSRRVDEFPPNAYIDLQRTSLDGSRKARVSKFWRKLMAR